MGGISYGAHFLGAHQVTEKKDVLIINKATGEETHGHQIVKTARASSLTGSGAPTSERPLLSVPTASEADAQKSKKPRAPLTSMSALIEYGYSRKGQRVTAKAGELKAISGAVVLTEIEEENLRALAAEDQLFAVPRQLLLFARELRETPRIRGVLREFVAAVLESHPIVVMNGLQSMVRNQEGAPSAAEAFRAIATTKALQEQPSVEGSLRSGELAALKRNVIGCLAVWVVDTRAISMADLMSALLEGYWEPVSSADPSEAELLRVLTEVDQPLVVGAICREFGRRAADQARLAERSAQTTAAARADLHRVSTELELARANVAALEAELQNARRVLQAERDNALVDASHLRTDAETLRTRVLRRLSDDLKLLGDGLIALSRVPPKVDVMVDHAERVADSLRVEIRKLEEGR
jgi:hypothetical protein